MKKLVMLSLGVLLLSIYHSRGAFVISAVEEPSGFSYGSETIYHYKFDKTSSFPDYTVKVSENVSYPDVTIALIGDPSEANLILADDLNSSDMKVCKTESTFTTVEIKTIKVDSTASFPDLSVKLITDSSKTADYKMLVQSDRFTRQEAAALFAVIWEANKERRSEDSDSVAADLPSEECQLSGDFNGWEGDTVVRLMNGVAFQQNDSHYEYSYEYSPKATLIMTHSGLKLKVEGTKKAVGVTLLGPSMECTVKGSFNGWDGDTVVELLNGQAWKQKEYHYDYTYSSYPTAILIQTDYGIKMQVEGCSKAVGVVRIR